MSNAYELRLELFREARDYLTNLYDRNVLEWDRLNQEKLDRENKYQQDWSRWSDLRDEGKATAEDCPICPDPIQLPKYPEYPSKYEILRTAEFIKSFTDGNGIYEVKTEEV
jgi:hypothetical protein|tara:strand:- start:256 stop:588 length:333 start_codon:yes stop_codon:yes gene_type:complete